MFVDSVHGERSSWVGGGGDHVGVGANSDDVWSVPACAGEATRVKLRST